MKFGAIIMITFILALAYAGVLGCAPGMIEGSTVKASSENKEVWMVVQDYRRAVEERNLDALMDLISRNYFDNAATTDISDDDYGYDFLRERYLPILRNNIKKVRMDLRATNIHVRGNRASAQFEQHLRFLFTEGGKDAWRTVKDFNELVFVREGGNWKIASGL